MVVRHAWALGLIAAFPLAASACGIVSETAEVRAAPLSGEMQLGDGRRLRLAGLALAPAADAALQGYVGQRFGLAVFAPKPDRWGRSLVDLVDPGGGSLALDLLRQGLARVRPEPETRACEPERLEAEGAARTARAGVWGEAGGVIEAHDVAALGGADGRFVLVAGVVRRVGGAGARVYLDFAGRGGFAVVAPAKALPQFRRAGIDLLALVGQRVRVRGVLELRFGPRIEVIDPLMIEILEKETGRGG